jgi:hypothetical protein
VLHVVGEGASTQADHQRLWIAVEWLIGNGVLERAADNHGFAAMVLVDLDADPARWTRREGEA